ncbi:MAG: T9SS type A sorting domain-containing protein [Bacteroidales bacterium]|nr:T9SS type A sorting domain-containing protein [Bacteroidales bacterium]
MPLKYNNHKTIPVIELPFISEQKAAKVSEETLLSRHKNEEFAYITEVQYNYMNSGVWDTLENGWKIWRLGIRSEGAFALNLIFTEYRLEKGIKVFLFDPMQKHTLGAYTHNNNKAFGLLAVEPVPGDMLFVEMQVPPTVSDPGNLCIGLIGHDYKKRVPEKNTQDDWYGLSGYCNPDICCYDDSLFSLIKHSVVRVVYAGKERCTGTLITNTRNNARPYLLTAGHCIKSEWLANTAVYFFEYESPYCGGPDGRNHKSLSGGTLKATTDNKLDFSLIELSEPVPFYYHPYFAGWDVTGLATKSAFCIHHPQGDVKKIALENDQPVTDNFGEGYNANTHWLIRDWETGTTEKGSSGAALFSAAGRVSGTLSGGDAYCDNSVNDFFQKLSHSWDDYPDSANQLRCWLDPFKGTIETIKGYDPFTGFWSTGDTLSNILPEEHIRLSGEGLSWGYLSGHNSDFIEVYAERFIVSERKYLLGVTIDVARAYAHSDTAIVKMCLWEGMIFNEEPLIQEEIPLMDFLSNTTVFVEFDSVISVSDTFMIGFKLFYPTPCDTFAVKHVIRDAGYDNTAFIVKEGQWIAMNDPFAYNASVSLSLHPVIYDSLPSGPGDEPLVINDFLMIYPNPARDGIWITFKQFPSEEITVRLFDFTGHLLFVKTYPDSINPLYIPMDIPVQGAYIIQVIAGQHVDNQKLLLLR